MSKNDIVIESTCSGNLQVSGKQDTYHLEIKEDLGKFCCFLLCQRQLKIMTLLFGFIKKSGKNIMVNVDNISERNNTLMPGNFGLWLFLSNKTKNECWLIFGIDGFTKICFK